MVKSFGTSTTRTSRRPVPNEHELAARPPGDTALVSPCPAVPNLPQPYGDLSASPIQELVTVATQAWNGARVTHQKRSISVRKFAGHLAEFPGSTWQERWLASGLDTSDNTRALLKPPARGAGSMCDGMRIMAALRVIQPSVFALRRTTLKEYGEFFREAQRDPLLDEFFTRVRAMSTSREHQRRAETDLAFALTSQSIGLADLSAQALLHYAVEHRAAAPTITQQGLLGGVLTWQILHSMGRFSPETPTTMHLALHDRRKNIDELVDRYDLNNREVRQLLVDYLRHRQSRGMDYATLKRLSMILAKHFWKTIETINPQQADLRLSDDTYQAWREEISLVETRGGGTRARNDIYGILLPVRALYLDLQSWSTAEPERWARWVAACPIPPWATQGYGKDRQRQIDRMADRTRQRQPVLPALTKHVADQYEHYRELLQRTTDATTDEAIEVQGRTYHRLWTHCDQKGIRYGQERKRLREVDSGAVVNVAALEERAFWGWAVVEVLRLTGIRHEELLELTQLSVRQYQRPNGEVIALLVIAPSKTDQERVIPMSAELFHVIAAIIRRHTRANGSVPLVQRWDSYENEFSERLPFLFQRGSGPGSRVCSTHWVAATLRRCCGELAEGRTEFAGIHFTPHDFRRLFATELVNNGLPIHIGAALLGHTNVQTTRGYVAVFDEDVVRHYQQFLQRRRELRPTDEYRPATAEEWDEFQQHFDKRKVELGSCGRPYGTPCKHEHACIRCPMLQVNPKMLDRLDDIETSLVSRRQRAEGEGWLGEIEGIDLTLTFLRQKREQTQRLTRHGPTDLGMPDPSASRSPSEAASNVTL